MATSFRIGTGAGFSADRLDPALDLIAHGKLDVIVFECIGERTLAFGHRDRMANRQAGYNALLDRRMRAVLPLCAAHGTRLVTNMGVANPRGAAERTAAIARELGLRDLRIAALEGDDVHALIGPDTPLPEAGITVAEVGRPLVGANAYLGADALLPGIEADVLITGRVADPSLFLAPLRHAFGWADDDWPTLGAGTIVGHLMECAAQITGGYFADPGYKDVPNLAHVGFPIAEVAADGSAVITKLASAGGMVSEQTVKEQLLYEVHDPAAYVTPDVVADFSRAQIRQVGPDRVQVQGGSGARRPDRLKVTVAFDGGLLAEAGISYAGPGRPRPRRARRCDRGRAHAPRPRHQRAAPPRPGRRRRPARHGATLSRRSPGRPPARSTPRLLARAGGAAAVGGRIPALLRPGRRRRLPRPDHALRDHPQRLPGPRPGPHPHHHGHPMTSVPLREIAHARAGDKGNISSIGVFVTDPATIRRSRRS